MDTKELTRKICSAYGIKLKQLDIRRDTTGWTVRVYRAQRKILVATITQYNSERYSLVLASTPYYADGADDSKRCIEAAWSLLTYLERQSGNDVV